VAVQPAAAVSDLLAVVRGKENGCTMNTRDSTSKVMTAKDMQPFAIVDDAGFRSFSTTLHQLGTSCGKGDVSDILYDRTTLAKRSFSVAEKR